MNSHNPFVIRAQPELNTNPIKNLLLGLALGVTRSNSGWAQPEHELFFYGLSLGGASTSPKPTDLQS